MKGWNGGFAASHYVRLSALCASAPFISRALAGELIEQLRMRMNHSQQSSRCNSWRPASLFPVLNGIHRYLQQASEFLLRQVDGLTRGDRQQLLGRVGTTFLARLHLLDGLEQLGVLFVIFRFLVNEMLSLDQPQKIGVRPQFPLPISLEEPADIERILDHLGHTAEPVDPAHPSRAPQQGDRIQWPLFTAYPPGAA